MAKIAHIFNIKFLFFSLLLLTHQVFVLYLQESLHGIHYSNQNLFFLDLTNITISIPYFAFYIFGLGNLIIIWLVSKLIFQKLSLVPVIIYAIIPWTNYLVAAESFYVYLSFISLLTIFGLALIKLNYQTTGSILTIAACIMGIYSSIFFLLLMPTILALLIVSKIVVLPKLKLSLAIIIIAAIPLLFLVYHNQTGFKNILNNEIKLFKDPGLINNVNTFQGAAQKAGFGMLSKISENRYLFYSEYLFLKVAKHFVPSTYFTSQEKLLNFSFTSPIYLGFLIPFIYGIYKITKLPFLRNIFFISMLLMIPSVLAKQLVDLNRLFIIAPILIFIISYGLIEMYEQLNKYYSSGKKTLLSIFLSLTVFLLVLQIVMTFSDINLREKHRFIRYNGYNFEIGMQ